MTKKFPPQLKKAWMQYSALNDKFNKVMRRLGEGDLNSIYREFEEEIRYATEDWQSPDERFDVGCFDDLDFDVEGEEE